MSRSTTASISSFAGRAAVLCSLVAGSLALADPPASAAVPNGPRAGYPTGSGVADLATADFDGDGFADIAVLSVGDEVVRVFLNCGDRAPKACGGAGAFRPPSSWTVHDPASGAANSGPNALAVADLDVDGRVDLLVTNGAAQSFVTLAGRGDGTFDPPRFERVGQDLNGVVFTDFTVDGIPDPVFSGGSSNNVFGAPKCVTRRGVGACGAPAQREPSSVDTIASADVDGDGVRDIVVGLDTPSTNTIDVIRPEPSTLLGASLGRLESFMQLFLPKSAGGVTEIVSWNPNGDRLDDLLAVESDGTTSTIFSFVTRGPKEYGFGGSTVVPGGRARLAVGDVDRDGHDDVIVTTQQNGAARVLLDDGSGSLAKGTILLATTDAPNMVASADFDRDGSADVVLAGGSRGLVEVLLSGDQPAAAGIRQPPGILDITVTSIDVGSGRIVPYPRPYPVPPNVPFTFRGVPVNGSVAYNGFTVGSVESPGVYTQAKADFVYTTLWHCQLGRRSISIFDRVDPFGAQTTADAGFGLTPLQRRFGAVVWLAADCAHWFVDAALAYDRLAAYLDVSDPQPVFADLVFTNELIRKVANFDPSNLLGVVCPDGCRVSHRETLTTMMPYQLVATFKPTATLDETFTAAVQGVELQFGSTRDLHAFLVRGCRSGSELVMNPRRVDPFSLQPTGEVGVVQIGPFGVPVLVSQPQCIRIPVGCASVPTRLTGSQASFRNWINYLMDPQGFANCTYQVDFAMGSAGTAMELVDAIASLAALVNIGRGISRVTASVDGPTAPDFPQRPIFTVGAAFSAPAFSTPLAVNILGAQFSGRSTPVLSVDRRAPTSTSEVSVSSPIERGRPVTLSANVAGAAPGGVVTFSDGNGAIPGCTGVPVGADGVALCTTTFADVGVHLLGAGYGGTATTSPSSSEVLAPVEVALATLLVRANDHSMTYGDLPPALDATIIGLVAGEDRSVVTGPTCVAAGPDGRPVGPSTPTGTYTVTCTAAAPGYRIDARPGVLTVTPAPLHATVAPTVRQYGDPDPAFPIVLSDARAVLDRQPPCSTSAPDDAFVATYVVTCDLRGVTAANFAFDAPVAIGTMRVEAEVATARFAGPTTALADATGTATLTLAGTISQDDDGHPGDLTRAVVSFSLTSEGRDPVVVTGGPVDAAGRTAAVVSVPVGEWKVAISGLNGFWNVSSGDDATLTVRSAVPDYEAEVLADAPVAFWPLREASGVALDLSGRGHDGTYVGVTRAAAGPAGRAATWLNDDRPTNGHVAAVDDGTLSLVGDLTIEAWVRPEASAGNYQMVVTKSPGADARFDGTPSSYELWLRPDLVPEFRQTAGVGNPMAHADRPLPAGVWTHLVVTRARGVVRFFVDGVDAGAKDTGVDPVRSNDLPVLIGSRTDQQGPGSYFNLRGAIADVSLFDHALTAERVAAHHRAGGPTDG